MFSYFAYGNAILQNLHGNTRHYNVGLVFVMYTIINTMGKP